jgi:hypothetical protein
MAITIDWGTRVINVPRADLPVQQASPEVRTLDLDWFRLQLKELEDDEEGMTFPDTHIHNTEVQIGGITLSRVIEVTNGYTVTFEDGQYSVDCTGANSNIMDVANPNQVSIRSNNSAGLIHPTQPLRFWIVWRTGTELWPNPAKNTWARPREFLYRPDSIHLLRGN